MKNKLYKINELREIVKDSQIKGKKVVFTNGCFDFIHAGHVTYLREAKKLGDILVIGLNSDSSVRRLKGISRPINEQKDRALILSEFESVDYIVIFEEDTPYNVIKQLNPDVLAKGGDWKINDIVGADIVLANGGDVISLSFIEGLSSTAILNKLRKEK